MTYNNSSFGMSLTWNLALSANCNYKWSLKLRIYNIPYCNRRRQGIANGTKC